MMKLSIITINRNNGVGLRKTIKSVISQNFNDIEYIVIDGASTDESVEIIKEYSSQIFYWVSEPDNGIYNAMNKGILKASGDYLLFLNSGDWLVDNILDELIEKYNFTYDIIYGNTFIEDNIKNKVHSHKAFCKDKITFYDLRFDTICHQSTFMKRDLFQRYGLYDENFKIISDWLFFIKVIIFENVSVKYVDIFVSYVEANGIGSSLNANVEKENVIKTLLPIKILEDFDIMKEQSILIDKLSADLNRYKNRFYLIDKIVSVVKKIFMH